MAEELKVALASKGLIAEYLAFVNTQLENRPVGRADEELYWAAGPEGTGFYMGEVGGEWVTGVAMMQHSDTYGWVNVYSCKEAYRGKGFGLKTWQTAQKTISPGVTLGLNTFSDTVPMYEKVGFKKAWDMAYCYIQVSSIIGAYSNAAINRNGVHIQPATEVDFEKLRSYVESIVGVKFTQAGLLEKLITLPTHTAVVALSSSETLVGFAAIKECISFKDKGYHLSPVLAETGDIARLLLLSLAKQVDVTQKFNVTAYHATNLETSRILDEVKGEVMKSGVRMYLGEEKPDVKEKYYAELILVG